MTDSGQRIEARRRLVLLGNDNGEDVVLGEPSAAAAISEARRLVAAHPGRLIAIEWLDTSKSWWTRFWIGGLQMLTMTTFANGPDGTYITGKTLSLARSPLFLRLVIKPDGDTDALDQLDDTPAADEAVFAYRKDPDRCGTMHIDRVDPKTRRRVGEWYHTATYLLVQPQPDEAVLRDTAAWQKWCQEEQQKG